MSIWLAHVICVVCVAADLVARAWRIQLLVRGVGASMSFRDGLALNIIGDGASAVTPLRLGGEPARFAVLAGSGVRTAPAVVALVYEFLAYWPVVVLFALVLLVLFAPAWLALVGPKFWSAIAQWWPWAVGIGVISLGVLLGVKWWQRTRGAAWAASAMEQIRAVGWHWRQMPWGVLVASVPSTLVSVVSRTALLPVLVLAVPDPPSLGPVILGSFVLLFGQLILPTPAGVGAVELGFFAGAAGDLGPDAVVVLALWRFYSIGIGVVLAAWLAIRYFGWKGLQRMVRGGRPALGRSAGPDGSISA